ncbi:hypothetical protein [Bradyrhizobium macuxiense]|uniref:hypothetical protein n=1 Tax=Bradyrhizobium macuxiense TaxID=1755647 RepID=UPI0011BEC170|nr:hypothetical protein [Bradyrhizobium macuxiense]
MKKQFPSYSILRTTARHERAGASPSALKSLIRMNAELDFGPILGSVRTPCLLLHRAGDRAAVVAAAAPNQVLVSSTLKNLVARSNIKFQDYGSRTLKGLDHKTRLFEMAAH